MNTTRRRLLKLMAGIVPMSAYHNAHADKYPSRPIRMIVPWPPGAIVDVWGRQVPESLRKALGQPVVVDNRPGVTFASSSNLVVAPALQMEAAYDVLKDLQPVTQYVTAACLRASLHRFIGDLVKHTRRLYPQMLATGAGLMILASGAWADPVYLGTPFPVAPVAGTSVPNILQVPGKEYTDFSEEDHVGVLDPLQNVAWDGLGRTADSDDFDAAFPTFANAREIDAIASFDVLFDEVLADMAALLVSVEADPGGVAVWSHAGFGGHAAAVWALQTDVDSSGHINDLDALDVWGPDFIGDSNRLSLFGDPGGVAIYDCVLPAAPRGCTPAAGATTSSIAFAISSLPDGLGGTYAEVINHIDQVDLDALMYDENSPADDDDRILFSLRPMIDSLGATILDGGEVFLWTIGSPFASMLVQGGDAWDTAHCVVCEFGAENVDALEAVASKSRDIPAPPTAALLGLVLLGVGLRRRLAGAFF